VPLEVNSSIKRQNSDEGGLIGGFFRFVDRNKVRDFFEEPNPNQILGISCNHVIANINACNVGDVLTDKNGNQIGTLDYWLILEDTGSLVVNKAEFALFQPNSNPPFVWSNKYSSFKPSCFANAYLNAKVVFIKPNGPIARGQVTDINHRVSITWNNRQYHFNCIEVSPIGGNQFSQPGDSGGAVYLNNSLLGIIFGVSHDGSRSYIIPYIDGILNFVDLEIY